MKINFHVGDWSGDGHMQHEVYIYEVNLSKKDLHKAFIKGCKKIGIKCSVSSNENNSPELQICSEYEDDHVPDEVIDLMIKAGLNPEDYFEKGYHFFRGVSNKFTNLWLDIAKIGNNNLIYIGPETGTESIEVGGYGLFR